MAEKRPGFWLEARILLGGLVSLCDSFKRDLTRPRPSSLRTADECMEVADDLGSDRLTAHLAREYVQRAIELAPDHFRANEYLASHYFTSGDFEVALPYALKVARMRPGKVTGRMTLGQIWKGLGQPAKAGDEFWAALALSPTSPGLWVMLAESLSALGRHAEAADAYAKRLALSVGPQDTFSPGEIRYANDPEAAVAYARELQLAGRLQDAQDVWRSVLALSPLSPSTRDEAERSLRAFSHFRL